jgi:hypothetical protein
MPARPFAAGDAGERKLDRRVAEEGHHPLDRSPERRVPRPPAHRFAEGDLLRDLREHLAQKLERRFAGFAARAGEVLAFRRIDGAKLVHLAAELVRESFGRPRRLAFFVERGAHRRSGQLLAEVGLPIGQIAHENGEPARRAVRADLGVLESLLAEALREQRG